MKLFLSLICVLLLPSFAFAQGSVGGSQLSGGSVGSQAYGSVGSAVYSTTTVSRFTYAQSAAIVSNDGPRFRLFPRLRQRACQTRTFAADSVSAHLIQDHGIPRLRVMAMTPWQREQLHNRLHGG